MKKKEFLSKLKLQKTTIVSFNTVKTIKGGTLQGADTQIVSRNGFTCLSGACVPIETQNDICVSIVADLCPRPTTRTTTDSVFCNGGTQGDDSKIVCTETQVVC